MTIKQIRHRGGGRNSPTDSNLTDQAREIAESNPDIAADATTDELNELAEIEDNFTPAWEQNMSARLQADKTVTTGESNNTPQETTAETGTETTAATPTQTSTPDE